MGITRATNCLIHCKEIVRRIALSTFFKKNWGQIEKLKLFQVRVDYVSFDVQKF